MSFVFTSVVVIWTSRSCARYSGSAVSISWIAAADARVLIPMRGIADSLNVAAAGAMLLYEALRQTGFPQMS